MPKIITGSPNGNLKKIYFPKQFLDKRTRWSGKTLNSLHLNFSIVSLHSRGDLRLEFIFLGKIKVLIDLSRTAQATLSPKNKLINPNLFGAEPIKMPPSFNAL